MKMHTTKFNTCHALAVFLARSLRKCSFAIVVSALGLLAVAPPAEAADESTPCSPEPTDMMIAYGDVLNGPDCTISPAGDTDIFRFAGSVGELVRVLASPTTSGTACIEVFEPSSALIASNCSPFAAQVDPTLTQAGVHTIVISESLNDGTISYALSLDRINPPSPASSPLFYGQILEEMISPQSDQDQFYFTGSVGDVVRVIATPTTSGTACVEVFEPSSALIASNCSPFAAQVDPTLTQAGVHTIVISESLNDGAINYNASLQCLLGPCAPPPCTLEIGLSYDAGEMTINFDVQSGQPVDWAAWLSYFGGTVLIGAAPIPAIPPTSGPVTFALPALGRVGVLTTFSTPSLGLVCSDFETVETASSLLSVGAPAVLKEGDIEISSDFPGQGQGPGGNPGRGRGTPGGGR